MQAVLLSHFEICVPSAASNQALVGRLDSQRHILTPFSRKDTSELHLNLFGTTAITSPCCCKEFLFSPFNSCETSSVSKDFILQKQQRGLWRNKTATQIQCLLKIFYVKNTEKYFLFKEEKYTAWWHWSRYVRKVSAAPQPVTGVMTQFGS